MTSKSRTLAESHFRTTDKHQEKALSEQEKAARAINEKTARLKALRLAKEAKDRAEMPTTQAGTRKRDVGRSSS